MNDDHTTPKWLIESLEKEFGEFDLDPCASSNYGNWFAKTNFNPKICPNDDGLKTSWTGKVFVNPPYSRGEIGKWLDKAYSEIINCSLIVILLPCDTSTKWFHKWFCEEHFDYSLPYYTIPNNLTAELRFLNRIKFSNSKHSARFPSMLVILKSNEYKINRHYP